MLEMLLEAGMSAERAKALNLEESHYLQAAVELKDCEFFLTRLLAAMCLTFASCSYSKSANKWRFLVHNNNAYYYY